MTFIKFCGMTRVEDVETAIELGIDAIGVVLWPGSPRHVTLQQATRLVSILPEHVTPVGVFVRPTRDDVAQAVEQIGIRVAQLHGVSDVSFESLSCRFWVAISPPVNGAAVSVDTDHMILLDAHDPVRHGGTGQTIDWNGAARIARTRSIVLAGGLTAANVGEAIRTVRPFGVDVASGIETSAGVKNEAAMREFVAAVRGTDQ